MVCGVLFAVAVTVEVKAQYIIRRLSIRIDEIARHQEVSRQTIRQNSV